MGNSTTQISRKTKNDREGRFPDALQVLEYKNGEGEVRTEKNGGVF